MQGEGKINFLSTKERYEGNFDKGELHGFGTLTDSKGVKKSGNWIRGKLIRKAEGLSDDEIIKLIELLE